MKQELFGMRGPMPNGSCWTWLTRGESFSFAVLQGPGGHERRTIS